MEVHLLDEAETVFEDEQQPRWEDEIASMSGRITNRTCTLLFFCRDIIRRSFELTTYYTSHMP